MGRYVAGIKSRLTGELDFIEQNSVNNDIKDSFGDAVGAALRFINFLTKTHKYRGADRNDMLKHILDYLNSTKAALASICDPFGTQHCGLSDVHPEAIYPLTEFVKNVSEKVNWVRDQLNNNSFVSGNDAVQWIKDACNKIDFKQMLEGLVGPNCNDHPATKFQKVSRTTTITMREDLPLYSESHELGTNGDDGCIQTFADRYTGYSTDALAKLKKALGKYVYLAVNTRGFCLPFSSPYGYLSVMEEVVHEMQHVAGTIRAGVAAINHRQVDENDIKTHILQVAKDAVNKTKKALDAVGWAAREKLHWTIVNETVEALNGRNLTGYVFNALALLPYDGGDKMCLPSNSTNVGYRNLNYFVYYAKNARKLACEKAVDEIKGQKDAILSRVFGTSAGNLCDRLKTAIKDHGGDVSRFGGVAAVKCGYKFVWYQLGYSYFYAAESTTRHKWAKRGGEYDAKCGQLFFFP